MADMQAMTLRQLSMANYSGLVELPVSYTHLNYVATLAAKQRDPRVDTRFYTLELTPGITYRLNNSHKDVYKRQTQPPVFLLSESYSLFARI